MTQIGKLYAWLLINPHGQIAFRDFERLLRAFGFAELRQRGSHRSWRHPAAPELLVIQPKGSEAKAYQVRAFLDIVRDCGLSLEDR